MNMQKKDAPSIARSVIDTDHESQFDTYGDVKPNAESAAASARPKRFGKFEIVRLLGEGGMGAVYLAIDSQLGRQVALKLPKIRGSKAAETVDRFRREARTAANLTHPGICSIYEFGEIEDQFYLAMAYVEGRELTYFVKKPKPLQPRQVALLMRKLAQAVAAAHAKGIVHRDLKPGNVMIDKQGQPIVMDFGLARRDESNDTRLTQTGAFVGTPAYCSPEQITNDTGAVDHRTDIYSLGVIMYEMLAGRLPFQADNVMSMLGQVLTGTPESPIVHRPDACPRLSEIAMKAIRRDLNERCQNAEELVQELTDYLKGNTALRNVDRLAGTDDSETERSVVAGTTAIEAESIRLLSDNSYQENLPAFFSVSAVKPRSRKSKPARRKTAAGNGRSGRLKLIA